MLLVAAAFRRHGDGLAKFSARLCKGARASSSLIFGDLIEDRLPRLLLLVDERRGFGGRHVIRIAAERCKLPFASMRRTQKLTSRHCRRQSSQDGRTMG
jgi:hypothetical protein